jgi:hypothetical protein
MDNLSASNKRPLEIIFTVRNVTIMRMIILTNSLLFVMEAATKPPPENEISSHA